MSTVGRTRECVTAGETAVKPMNPIQIKTLEQLEAAALERRSVFCPESKGLMKTKPMPAAFVISMQARMVLNLMRAGLYVYTK